MITNTYHIQAALVIIFLLVPVLLQGQVTAEEYERANNLQEQFEGKALNVIDEPTWIGDTHHLWYRKTVQEGHKFIWVDADNKRKRDAFDHERMAETLSANRDTTFSALELPFDEIKFVNNENGVKFEVGDSVYTCKLENYTCESEAKKDKDGQGGWNPWSKDDGPEGDSDERIASPDGEWEAYVQNYNVAVSQKDSDKTTMLSTDGSEGNYYDIDTFEWSPNSKKLVAFRLKPGYDRQVHYIESSPEDQLQPIHRHRTYLKPGDALDEKQPVWVLSQRLQLNIKPIA